MKILMVGDVYGAMGRKILFDKLPEIRSLKGINFVVVNGENIAHDWSAVKGHYRLTINKDATELTFENLSGSHIQQEIKVAVPVYVQTKWNPALADPTTATVILTIKPGDYE